MALRSQGGHKKVGRLVQSGSKVSHSVIGALDGGAVTYLGVASDAQTWRGRPAVRRCKAGGLLMLSSSLCPDIESVLGKSQKKHTYSLLTLGFCLFLF